MEKEDLIAYKEMLSKLSEEEKKKRDVYLRNISLGKLQGPNTGYASIDKPWLKYYSETGIVKSVPKISAFEYLINSCENYMGKTALDLRMSFNNFEKSVRTVTYGDFIEEVVTFACGLKAYGFSEDEILVHMLPNLIESRESIYAADGIGTTIYPISPMLPSNKFKEILSDKKIKSIIIYGDFYNKFKKDIDNSNIEKIIYITGLESFNSIMRNIIKIKDKKSKENKYIIPNDKRFITWDNIINAGKKYRKANKIKSYKDFKCYYNPTHISCIVGTSGTTGIPKGACLTDLAFNAAAFCNQVPESFKPGESFVDVLIQSISYGLSIMHLSMSGGLYNYLIPEMVTDKIPYLLSKFKPEHFSGGPVHYENILRSDEFKNGQLAKPKNYLSGGASLSKATESKLNSGIDENYKEPLNGETKVFVRQGLGLTENTGTGIFSARGSYKFGSVGIPLALSNCSIFKFGTDEELKIGEIGEICMTGDTMMEQYYKNPDETEKIIKTHSDGTKWIHSADQGYMDKDGNIFMLDRYKNIFMRNGFNVHPAKIIELLNSSRMVEKSHVIGINHPMEMCVPVAFVVLKPGFTQEEAIKELDDLCFVNLDEYFMPYEYVFVDSLPLNLSGKVVESELLKKYPIDYSKENVKKMNLR